MTHLTLNVGVFAFIMKGHYLNIKYLQECIIFEIKIRRKCCKFICLYRSPSQTNGEYKSFLKNFELTLDKTHGDNPFMISVLAGFNAKSNNWCKNDTTSHEDSMFDAVTSNYGLHQLNQEPTHILNSSFSCNDLIFTCQPNLVLESGNHSSLHQNCYHQVVFAKFNLSIFYPPPCERTIWFYKKANPELIWRAIYEFDRIRALSNVNLDEKVCHFTETLLNTIHNFTPHEKTVCDKRNPPWINNEIKRIINGRILLTNHTAVLIEMCFFMRVLNFSKTN